MSYVSYDGMVLMLMKNRRENDPNSGFLTLPGGKLESWEKGLYNPEGRLEAAVRETEEETGLTPINLILRATILFDNAERIFDNWSNPEDYLVYIFSAEEYDGILKEETEEGLPLLVKKNDIPKFPKNKGDESMHDWLLKDSRCFYGVIKHKGKELDERGTFVDYFD